MKGDDILFKLMIANRVLAIAPGLTQADRLVGAAILAHWNTKTGQCDPGADRLAAVLGMHRATLFRAINRLCGETLGLFSRTSYGGRSHRNAYLPNWEAFEKMNDQFRSATVKAKREPSHQGTGEPSHQGTSNENYPNDGGSSLRSTLGANARPQKERQARKNQPDGQGYLVHAIAGGLERRRSASEPRGLSHGEAAEQAALRRWDDALRARLGTEAYGRVIELLDAKAIAAATSAEMARRGTGAE